MEGTHNCIDAVGANTKFGVIGGGQSNKVCAGTNHSSIFSGKGNTVSGSCSSILGGSGNSDGGNAYVGIFGQGITAAAANTFYANCLNACATPAFIPATFPPGSLMHVLAPAVLGFPAGTCMLLIQ